MNVSETFVSLDIPPSNLVSDTDDSICTPPLQLSSEPKKRVNNYYKRRGSAQLQPSKIDHVSFEANISAQSSSNNSYNTTPDPGPTFVNSTSSQSDTTDDYEETKEQTQLSESKFLKQKGLILGHKICDTLQGGLYAAKTLKGVDVIIKKTDRMLCLQREAIQDGMSVVVEENIIKESVILHHLTVVNRPIYDYIVQFINFFENESAFYLVMERAGNMNLEQFSKQAHALIEQGKMQIKHWKKIVKFIFWQIIVIVHWLHTNMRCCHLDLNLSNIMLLNAEFIENKDNGLFTVNPMCKIKLCDFGLAEVFEKRDQTFSNYDDYDDEYANNDFACNKHEIIDMENFCCPKKLHEETYDARKADIWSLGTILYVLTLGLEPSINNESYQMTSDLYHRRNYVSQKMVDLMKSMLKNDESQRFDSQSVIESPWLSMYYKKYKDEIEKQSIYQLKRNEKLSPKMDNFFPYYGIQ